MKYVKSLGSTLSNIACVVNPEIIVIGGGVSKAGDILLDNIKKHFVETAFMACRDTKFALGQDLYAMMLVMYGHFLRYSPGEMLKHFFGF